MTKKNNNRLILCHTQTKEETALLSAVTSRILSIVRIAVWCVFAAGLLLCFLFSVNEDNLRYAVPLSLLAGVLFVGTLVLLCFALYTKPKLIAAIEKNEGVFVQMVFTPENFTLTRADLPKLKAGYRCVLAQYWYEDSYILHLRIPVREGGRGDELIIFPLTEDTFDTAYTLAEALTEQKKRLVRIKTKRKPTSETPPEAPTDAPPEETKADE